MKFLALIQRIQHPLIMFRLLSEMLLLVLLISMIPLNLATSMLYHFKQLPMDLSSYLRLIVFFSFILAIVIGFYLFDRPIRTLRKQYEVPLLFYIKTTPGVRKPAIAKVFFAIRWWMIGLSVPAIVYIWISGHVMLGGSLGLVTLLIWGMSYTLLTIYRNMRLKYYNHYQKNS